MNRLFLKGGTMKTRIAMLVCLMGVVVLCTGCELGVLVSNPDAAQAFLSQRLDMFITGAADWALWFDQTLNTIETVVGPVL